MALRDRRRERREERHERREAPHGDEAAGPEVYRMRERLLDLGDDFWIETSRGRRAYRVDGTVLRVRETFDIKDLHGTILASIQQRVARVRDTMAIDRPGKPSATVKKALVAPLRERFVLEASDVGRIEIQGNLVAHEYTFDRDGTTVAEVSTRWLRVRDTYGVEIADTVDAPLILAATVALDALRE